MIKYDKYKSSEIDWLGDIPNDWEVKRVKDILIKIGSGVTPKGGSEVYVKSGIPLIRSQNVYDDGLRIDNVSFISEAINDKMKNSQIQPNDILINITGASIGRSCVVPNFLAKANINQHIIYLRINSKLVPFITYFIKSNSFKEYINLIQAGTSKEALNMGQTMNIPILLPDSNSQKNIVHFINKKTQAIDKKINLLTQKANYYKEYRKSLINETVCMGLDKNVKLKDSGIGWIGKIPEHWKIIRLKSLGNIETSSVDKKIIEDESLVKLVNYTDVYGNLNKEITNSDNYMVVSANINQLKSKLLKKGDVLFTPSSETIEDIGVSAVVMEDMGNTLYSYHLLRLRFSKNIHLNFKKYLFNNDFVQYYFSKSATGTTRKILGLSTFNNLPLILPETLEEQTQIAHYLDTKTQTIDKIISNINTQIQTLKELRKTVINDAVTGKIKVVS
jgi:type I restriction enzyme, S subunit